MYSPNIIFYSIFFVLGVLIIVLFVMLVKLNKRLKAVLGGKKPASIETILTHIQSHLESIDKNIDDIESELVLHDRRLKKSIGSSELLRFNPFQEVGGNQSFATALIDEQNNGFVLSSLYARERMSIFAKNVKNGKPEQELSDEEKKALAEAIKNNAQR